MKIFVRHSFFGFFIFFGSVFGQSTPLGLSLKRSLPPSSNFTKIFNADTVFPGPSLDGASQFSINYADSTNFYRFKMHVYDSAGNFLGRVRTKYDTISYNPSGGSVRLKNVGISTVCWSLHNGFVNLIDSLSTGALYAQLTVYVSSDSARFDSVSSYFHIFKRNQFSYITLKEVHSAQKLQAWPNPVSNVLNIQVPIPLGFKRVQIFNSNGVLVIDDLLKENKSYYSIDTSMWVKGLYYLYLIGNEKYKNIYKIIK